MGKDIIKIENIKKYFNEILVLNDLSLKIQRSNVVVICGPSGCGKSTLLRCLNGLEDLNSGDIIINDKSILDKKNLRAIRLELGMVFQQFNLFPHLTVLENLTLAPMKARGLSSKEANDIAIQYLERVQIPEQANKYPSQLSGGQQQRVGIARALAQEPGLMLADEPVTALDPVTSRHVMGDLQRINRELGITTVVNLHFLDLAREYGRRLIGLRDGEVVFDGDIADVTDETFRNIYGRAITDDDLLAVDGEPTE